MKTKITAVLISGASFLTSFTSLAQMSAETATSVTFKTSDTNLQSLVRAAEEKAQANIAQFGKYRIMVEGAGYKNVWLETQPMGGAMYGKRDPEIARNNIEIFMDHQRPDGRLPGMISVKDGKLVSHDGWFQGFCFAEPALETWYLLGKDKAFGDKLYICLEKFDAYLWKTRDSDGDGCLETWCVWDTGEDGCVRFGKAPSAWPLETPPSLEKMKELGRATYGVENAESDHFLLPIESMDVMSYSYTCRDVLARLSKAIGNGKEEAWRQKADEVRRTLKERLWDNQKNACYDRDRDNKTMDVLFQGNIKCMYMGSFDQEMADAFIRCNLMNKQVFWTPFPLPSIAANDKLFRNNTGNDWSGQPQGLTWQRSISALENYGHTAELTLLGKIFLANLAKHKKFTQQYDPYTGEPNKSANGYGPSLLATLEFVSRMYGIHVTQEQIWWSCLDTPDTVEYSRQINDTKVRMDTVGNIVNCYVNERKVLSFTKGVRVVTDKQGQLLAVVGIETDPRQMKIEFDGKAYEAEVYPNVTFGFTGKLQEVKRVSFYRPRGCSQGSQPHPDSKTWTDLFAADLSNASFPKDVWSFKDGELTATKDQCIWTTNQYENFILDLEFKLGEAANSGIIVYSTDTRNWVPGAVEIQLLDDGHPKWANVDPTWKCGGIFGHLAPSRQAVKKAGEWNRMTVTCKGSQITAILNDQQVLEADLSKWTSAKTNPDGSAIPSWLSKPMAELPRKGYIGLQGKHGGSPITFRNLKIKQL